MIEPLLFVLICLFSLILLALISDRQNHRFSQFSSNPPPHNHSTNAYRTETIFTYGVAKNTTNMTRFRVRMIPPPPPPPPPKGYTKSLGPGAPGR